MVTHLTIALKYFQNQALSSIVGFMYCNGSSYYKSGQALSSHEKKIIYSATDRLDDERKRIRHSNPELYIKRPYPEEGSNCLTHVTLQLNELNLLIIALRETIHESEKDNGYTLKVITSHALDTAKGVLKVLESYQLH